MTGLDPERTTAPDVSGLDPDHIRSSSTEELNFDLVGSIASTQVASTTGNAANESSNADDLMAVDEPTTAVEADVPDWSDPGVVAVNLEESLVVKFGQRRAHALCCRNQPPGH